MIGPTSIKNLICTALGLGLMAGGLRAYANEEKSPQAIRASEADTKMALIEGIRSLIDLQIRDHKGRHSPVYDSCQTGDGCASVFPVFDPRVTIGLPTPPFYPKMRNYPNEWGSSVHALTQTIKTPDGQAPLLVPDANMFVTASILYPLVFVDRAGEGTLGRIVKEALASLEYYRRNGAYAFWRSHPIEKASYEIIGPLNVPVDVIENIVKFIGKVVKAPPGGNPHRRPDGTGPNIREGWVKAIVDPQTNPIGFRSFFNIPSDADDTALAMIAQKTFGTPEPGELEALADELFRYRDLDRSFEDSRDSWKGKNSGAFLTWLKDESLPIAEGFDPRTGTIPFGINNVDCVVNANVVFALGLLGYGEDVAVRDALTALNRAIDLEAWPVCGLYYPHKMMLPYTLTRAYRDGGLSHPGKNEALKRIVVRLLSDQREVALRDPKKRGAFSGGVDQTYDLATALAVNALLNIGRQIPMELGLMDEYDRAIKAGVEFLVHGRKKMAIQFPENLGPLYLPGQKAAVWDPGLFFSASVQEAAHWRSPAYTAAIVTEALAKYLLAWDHSDGAIESPGFMKQKLKLF